MKRSQAERLIDDLRVMASDPTRPPITATELADWLAGYNLTPLEPCGGEAHSNAFIDNCHRCAPRWGFIGPRERVT